MSPLSRREFFRRLGALAAVPVVGPWLRRLSLDAPSAQCNIYVARNGTPVTNVQRVVEEAGGIQRFIGAR